MPGLAGIISEKPYEGIREELGAMVEVMRHEKFYRGGQYVNRSLGLQIGWISHENSFADCMPLISHDKNIVLIFQGENYLSEDTLTQLRRSGNRVDESNAQYLLNLYYETGDNFFARLNGWFCGILVDLGLRKITLFNDRYGMRRIYFHEGKNEFLFASEAKSLLRVRPGLRAIRADGLAEYLRYGCIVGNKTLFKNISLLPGGASWVFENGATPRRERYFDPSDWDRQPAIAPAEFYEKFAVTVSDVFPRYARDSRDVAIAATAGLDTRTIAAALQANGLSLPSYTFGGPYGETLDIQKARQIAAICRRSHEAIKLDHAFFKEFPEFAQKSVYLSDGAHDAFGAHDIYLNRIARHLAPVRLTGKYGSEIVKNRRLIHWISYSSDFFESDLKTFMKGLQPRDRLHRERSLSNTVFEELPWYEYGLLSIEQSQLTLRTPYMDNDLVKLMFQAPPEVRGAGQLQVRYIRETAPELRGLITNMGELGSGGALLGKIRYLFYRALFKTEYYYLFATPHWLTRIDRKLAKLHLEKIVAGREKFEGYRIWIKTHLGDFIRQTLSNPNARYVEFFDQKSVQGMVRRHLAGTHNYLNEINKVLTIELICTSLIDQKGPRSQSDLNRLAVRPS